LVIHTVVADDPHAAYTRAFWWLGGTLKIFGHGIVFLVVEETLNNFRFGTEHLRVIQIRIPLHRLRMATQKGKHWFLFPFVSKSGNRRDAVHLDIKRPRPSRNVNENPRRRVLQRQSRWIKP
jgi:hypothetical protein